MKGKTGIWIDGKKAIIVHLFSDTQVVDVLEADIEYQLRTPGEAPDVTRQGAHSVLNEEKEEERIRHERRHFLLKVVEKLDPVFEITIFGPAQTKHELRRLLNENTDFESIPINMETADSMTVNEFVDLVHDHYKIPAV